MYGKARHRVLDARRLLRSLPPATRFDVIFRDAFNDYEVPYHVTARQFDEFVARHLKPNSLYVLNVVDGVRHDFLRSEATQRGKMKPRPPPKKNAQW